MSVLTHSSTDLRRPGRWKDTRSVLGTPAPHERSYRRRLYEAYVRSGQAKTISGADDLEPRAPYLRRFVRSYFPKDRDSRVLDLGCGSGALLFFAREAGYCALRGVDVSLDQVAGAGRLGLDFVQQEDFFETLSAQPDESLDVIVAFDVLEHLSKDEVIEFLDKSYSALVAEGRLIVHAPNAESPFAAAVRYDDFTHEIAFTRFSITQVAAAVGFRRVECHEDRPIPHGPLSALRWLAWPVVNIALRAMTAIETGDPGKDAILSRNLVAVITK